MSTTAAVLTGAQTILVIPVYWTTPDSVTPADLKQRVFVDSDTWTREASYGTASLTGDVVPQWLKIEGPPNNDCEANYPPIFAQAKAAAAAAGFDASRYQRTITYFPRGGCLDSNSSGWAAGTDVAMDGFNLVELIVHELGHTNGLPHALTLQCSGATGPVVLAARDQCTTGYEYSDGMGNGPAVSFNAAFKNRIGWLPQRLATLTPGSSVRLQPYEKATANAAARLVTTTGRTYWFEYRQPIGIDAGLGAGLTNGVLVHLDDPGHETLLLDLTPNTPGDFTDATLTPGASWTTPEGITLSVSRADTTGITLTAAVAPTPPGQPTSVKATPTEKTRTITLGWQPPTTGGAVTGYTITRSGTDLAGRTATPVQLPATARSYAWTGLRPGVNYRFTVTANAAGLAGPAASVFSALSNLPGTPCVSAAYSGSYNDGVVSVTANWKPATWGGPATRYVATAVDISTGKRTSVTATGSATSIKIPGLVTNHKYKVEVYGTNTFGRGPAATATNTVTGR